MPSNKEWGTLIDYLADNGYNFDGSTGGGPSKIAKALASKTGWADAEFNGNIGHIPAENNTSGFTATPIGYREISGTYYPSGTYGYWWSSTLAEEDGAYARLLGYVYSEIGLNDYNKSYGFAVRCVKDDR